MNRKSRYNIKIDFEKSHDSYIFDKNSNSEFLDFFGQYATLVLGYNHEIFNSKEYIEKIKNISHQKIVNNEIASDEAMEFNEAFINFASFGDFHFMHYACTGALAIEAAIKTAIDYKNNNSHRVISFKGSFHGINGYGGIVTDRFHPVSDRLDGLPGSYWSKFDNPTVSSYDRVGNKEISSRVQKLLSSIKKTISQENNICGILVEPIQCTNGDLYFTDEFFIGLRSIATEFDIPLIFDEVQTGFGVTGKIWYYQNLPITPDIVVFGKKTQLSGIMVNKSFSKIFQNPIRLEVTWDADIMDMVRAKYVIEAFKKYNILENVKKRSLELYNGLKSIKGFKNLRYCGLLFGFDFDSSTIRDNFVNELFKNQMIVNPTKDLSVRLRPPLTLSNLEVNHALNVIEKSMNKIIKG